MEQTIQQHIEMIANAKRAAERAVRERYGFIPPEYMSHDYTTAVKAMRRAAAPSLFAEVRTFSTRSEAVAHLQTRDTNAIGFKKPIVRPKTPFGKHIVKYVEKDTGLEYSLNATKGWMITYKHPVEDKHAN